MDENQLELERHHKDFERISRLCQEALRINSRYPSANSQMRHYLVEYIRAIQNIVG